MNKSHDDFDDYFLSRLTYKASGQNPVLDYMISVEELPERFFKIVSFDFLSLNFFGNISIVNIL